MKRIVSWALLLVVAVSIGGCATIDEGLQKIGLSPERAESVSTTIRQVGAIIPGPAGDAAAYAGWGVSVLATAWGAWQRNKKKRYLAAAAATCAGIDAAENAMKEPDLVKLKNLLMQHQSARNAWEVVREIRGKNDKG